MVDQGEIAELRHALRLVCDRINGSWMGPEAYRSRTHRFGGAGAALRWYVTVALDGYRMTNVADPDRLAHLSSRGSPGAPSDSMATREADDRLTVEQCLRTAVAEVLAYVPHLGQHGALFALLARGGAGASPQDTADRLAEMNLPVYVVDLAKATSRGYSAFSRELVAAGLLDRQEKSMDELSDADLVGWDTIATFLRVSERTAQRWAKSYGLPVRQLIVGGTTSRVEAYRKELRRWHLSHLRAVSDGGVQCLTLTA